MCLFFLGATERGNPASAAAPARPRSLDGDRRETPGPGLADRRNVMSPHPTITAALAEEHRRDLTARAEAWRLARAARTSRPVPACRAAGPVELIRQLVTALRRTAMRLAPRKVPAAPL